MENPYQPPKAKLVDFNYTPLPKVLTVLYWLASLALTCAVSSGFVVILQDNEVPYWFWEQQLLFGMILVALYGFIFTFYYFLIFRPLRQRKRSTSLWWFAAVLILSLLWLVAELIPGDESISNTWLENVLSVLELIFLSVGALFARRPASLQALPN